jgi:prepilin-type processing-associated H-X9-DG protein/prepilin-type N-terminal cleavage/methylation domain-containing protein
MRNLPRFRDGFTLTELSVLVAVGAILASVVAADLNQARTKLLQQACAANMKHWGMAFSMYADDYNGTFYYDAFGVHFTDLGSPLQRYFGNSSDPLTTLRTIRACPARVTQYPLLPGYQMPVGQYRKGLGYVHADINGSPFYENANAPYWPNLKSVPQPAQYLLMFECYNTLHCGELVSKMSNPGVSAGPVDPVPPIARHGGGAVNCLFGDFHVEFVSATTITNHGVGCNSSTGNVWLNLN